MNDMLGELQSMESKIDGTIDSKMGDVIGQAIESKMGGVIGQAIESRIDRRNEEIMSIITDLQKEIIELRKKLELVEEHSCENKNQLWESREDSKTPENPAVCPNTIDLTEHLIHTHEHWGTCNKTDRPALSDNPKMDEKTCILLTNAHSQIEEKPETVNIHEEDIESTRPSEANFNIPLHTMDGPAHCTLTNLAIHEVPDTIGTPEEECVRACGGIHVHEDESETDGELAYHILTNVDKEKQNTVTVINEENPCLLLTNVDTQHKEKPENVSIHDEDIDSIKSDRAMCDINVHKTEMDEEKTHLAMTNMNIKDEEKPETLCSHDEDIRSIKSVDASIVIDIKVHEGDREGETEV
jgi:hypothetical protein